MNPIQTDNNQGNTNNQNSISNDILVTQMVNPSQLSDEQLKRDLELLKESELDPNTNTPLVKTVKQEDNPLSFKPMVVSTVDVLKLNNPFKGE